MEINVEALKKRYTPFEVPACAICGGKLTKLNGGLEKHVYACTGAIYDETGVNMKEGRELGDSHSALSRWTDPSNGGDMEVIALLSQLEAERQRADAAEAKQEVEEYRRRFDRLWERYDEASHGNAQQMHDILADTLNALEQAENRISVLAQSHAQVIHLRDHYKALWRHEMLHRVQPKLVTGLPGGFSLDEARELVRNLIDAHTSKAMSGERMKAEARNEDLGWCRQQVVQAKWFIQASVEAYERSLPIYVAPSTGEEEKS
ncbi:ead/Ea22-like family protein [Citrobacter portucalensis]|uniref:ead/Ea22-like family protein n=1 Tax=Citrobacter portucalensis TaxID=1639133 RepID=UPI00226B34B0|nr:ead/Ea22-like family protein [Citrobacter portucalensis]MCX8980081.1 ead/Ea22-like family protein [Citrobacter portucalensis]